MNTKVILWIIFVSPVIFIIAILGSPFYALCCWAGEREVLEPMLDRVGERIKLYVESLGGE